MGLPQKIIHVKCKLKQESKNSCTNLSLHSMASDINQAYDCSSAKVLSAV